MPILRIRRAPFAGLGDDEFQRFRAGMLAGPVSRVISSATSTPVRLAFRVGALDSRPAIVGRGFTAPMGEQLPAQIVSATGRDRAATTGPVYAQLSLSKLC